MTCEPLAYTGGGRLDLLLAIAISCLAAGGLLLLMTRRRGRAVTVALLLLVCGAAVSITGGTPTGAMAADCPPAANSLPAADPLSPADPQSAANPQSAADPQSAANSLTVSQTSVMDGLAPGIARVAITGVVINNGADSTDIIAVDVEITGVITHPGAVPGPCDPSSMSCWTRECRSAGPLTPAARPHSPGHRSASTTSPPTRMPARAPPSSSCTQANPN